tara:strand:+ start:1663 stop:3141 length:1479 start_codon:yes stop_codon:yes gene_type:complete
MRSRSKNSKRSKLQRHKRYNTKRRLTKRRPSKRKLTKRRPGKRRLNKRKLTKNFQDINKIKYKTKKNKKIKKSLKYGGSNQSLPDCTEINAFLDMGLTLRLVRHGLPNSKSGIEAAIKLKNKYHFRGLRAAGALMKLAYKMKFLRREGMLDMPVEPTLYFKADFTPVENVEIVSHRETKLPKSSRSAMYSVVNLPQLFVFPVKVNPVEANPVQATPEHDAINLVVFVSPFLRTLETMLEMMASAIINRIEQENVRIFNIQIIVGPFTELKDFAKSFGNRFHPTTTTRFSHLLKGFTEIYLNSLRDVTVNFNLRACSGEDIDNFEIKELTIEADGIKEPIEFTECCKSQIYIVSGSSTNSRKSMDLFLCLEKVLLKSGIKALVTRDHFRELRVVTHSNRVKHLFSNGGANDPTKKINFFESLCIRQEQPDDPPPRRLHYEIEKVYGGDFAQLPEDNGYFITGNRSYYVVGLLRNPTIPGFHGRPVKPAYELFL